MNPSKPWYTSKIIWANVLAAVAAALAAPEIQAALGPDALRYVVGGQALINIALRFVTVAPIINSANEDRILRIDR